MEKPPESKGLGRPVEKDGHFYAKESYAAYHGEFQQTVDSALADLKEAWQRPLDL